MNIALIICVTYVLVAILVAKYCYRHYPEWYTVFRPSGTTWVCWAHGAAHSVCTECVELVEEGWHYGLNKPGDKFCNKHCKTVTVGCCTPGEVRQP